MKPSPISLIPQTIGRLRVLRLGLLLAAVGWGISFLFTFSSWEAASAVQNDLERSQHPMFVADITFCFVAAVLISAPLIPGLRKWRAEALDRQGVGNHGEDPGFAAVHPG